MNYYIQLIIRVVIILALYEIALEQLADWFSNKIHRTAGPIFLVISILLLVHFLGLI